MRKILLLCCLTLGLVHARAQYIYLPDSTWGSWLNTHGYASCLTGNSTSGWQLDTTCSAVRNDTTINCSNSKINDLTGITYFNSLTYLDCSFNLMDTLPVLPAGLKYLHCKSNLFTSLPSLSDRLRFFDCSYNHLSSLPLLPDSLQFLYCYNNSLDSLPNLPPNLQILYCYNTRLTALPSLPNSLTDLVCFSDRLSALPPLPASLSILYCNYNFISSLPMLPVGLKMLKCYNNQLTSLPSLPDSLVYLECGFNPIHALPALASGLVYLECDSNRLDSIPSLPNGLEVLLCSKNNLTQLPALPPNLSRLYCTYNQLTSLPSFPVSLSYLRCDHNDALSCLPYIRRSDMDEFYIRVTNIHCIPDSFIAFQHDINPTSLPICTLSDGCGLYSDVNEIKDISPIRLYPNPNGGSFVLETTNATGSDYQVYDMVGSLIAQGAITTDHQQIHMTDAAAGVYTLQVRREASVKQLRLVIEK